MKTLLAFLLFIGVASAQVPDHVVRVYPHHDDDAFYDGRGSGVLITPHYVLTAGHVLDKVRPSHYNVDIRLNDGRRVRGYSIANDKYYDVGLVRIVTVDDKTPLVFAEDIKEGEVTIQGVGPDYEFINNKGLLGTRQVKIDLPNDKIDFYESESGRFWDVATLARSGDSGAAVVQDDKLVGITLAININTKKTFIVPIDVIVIILENFLK